MGNLLKLKAAFAASAVTASIIAGAEAQVTSNSQLLAPPASDVVALVEKTSEREIRAFLEPLELTVTPFDDGDSTTYSMMATTEAGGQFLVTLFGCENPATGEGCEALTSYAGFSNAGLAYDDLNPVQYAVGSVESGESSRPEHGGFWRAAISRWGRQR